MGTRTDFALLYYLYMKAGLSCVALDSLSHISVQLLLLGIFDIREIIFCRAIAVAVGGKKKVLVREMRLSVLTDQWDEQSFFLCILLVLD